MVGVSNRTDSQKGEWATRMWFVLLLGLGIAANVRSEPLLSIPPFRSFDKPALAPDIPDLSFLARPADLPSVSIKPGYIPVFSQSFSDEPASPIWSPLILFSPPRVVSEVPEPASLYLFGFALCVSSWCLTRMMRPVEPSHEECAIEET